MMERLSEIKNKNHSLTESLNKMENDKVRFLKRFLNWKMNLPN